MSVIDSLTAGAISKLHNIIMSEVSAIIGIK